MTGLLYLLFFCSGLSGLIYQVVWVREFGNVFGNTIYSASLVIAVFMLGLGLGSYLVGIWADRRYAAQPESLLRTYGYVELIIALMGLGISALLPHLAWPQPSRACLRRVRISHGSPSAACGRSSAPFSPRRRL
jgi:predicted membrane-bound spermidine synthase